MAQTLSLRFIAETRQIAAIMRGGDIIMISMDAEGAPVRDSCVESFCRHSTSYQVGCRRNV